jgi:F420-0:gamma-glutamyl ligase
MRKAFPGAKSTPAEVTMSNPTLTAEQEQQAQALAARLREVVDADLVQLARLLVSKAEHEIFGQTEFEVRDIVHHLGATALQTHLGQKKTATAVAASSARTAGKARSSKTGGRASR